MMPFMIWVASFFRASDVEYVRPIEVLIFCPTIIFDTKLFSLRSFTIFKL